MVAMRWFSVGSFAASCALAIVLSLLPSSAHAQSDAGSDAQARALFEEGRAAYERGEFEVAMRAFRRAYVLSPRYALLYNIGQSELRIGHDAEALEALEGFLRQAPADDARRSEIEERVRVLRGLGVTPGRTTVQPDASDPSGSAHPPAPEAEPDDDARAPNAEPPHAASDDRGSGGPGVAPWIVTGLGGALLVTGAVLMGVGASDAARLTGAPRPSHWSEYQGIAGDAETMWAVGIALAGVGLAAAGAGLVWALLPSDSEGGAEARLRLAPGSLWLEGAF